MRNLFNKLPKQYVKQDYLAYFESIIRCGLSLYGNRVGLKDILLFQKKTIRVITRSPPDSPCKHLFMCGEGTSTVFNLYVLDLSLFLKKNISQYEDIFHSYSTRHSINVNIPILRLSKLHNIILISSISSWRGQGI